MTISDKIRIYELSRDLNLDNKDILDAAQKLSISVKSHSSSISAEDAKKIKNLINKKNSDKKILSINKPSIISSEKDKSLKENSNKKLLLCVHAFHVEKHMTGKIFSRLPKTISKASCFKREWGDQLTFASQKNATQIPRSKKSFKKL